MKKKQLLAILALMLALGLPLPLDLFLDFTDETREVVFDTLHVRSEAELFAALKNESIKKIIFENDIVLLTSLEVSRDVTLDLNNYNLTTLRENVSAIDVKYGKLILTGKGSIVAYGLNSAAIRVKGAITAGNSNYAHVTVGRKLRLFAPNYYGIFVAPNYNSAYGITIDFHGTIVARDGICIHRHIQGRGENAPVIKVADKAKITVDENEGIALHAGGFGRWQIGAAVITGSTGLVASTGDIEISKAKILATGNFDPNLTQPDSLQLGAVVQILDIESSRLNLTINGGEYTSAQGYTFAEDTTEGHSLRDFSILDGDFAGRQGVFYGLAPAQAEHSATHVLGGTFNADVKNYLGDDCHLERNRRTNIYTVIDDSEPEEILDDATLLARAEDKLRDLISVANEYIQGKFAAGDLGDWQPRVTKTLASVKRANTLAKKTLRFKPDLEKLESSIRSLTRAIENLQGIADDLRAELASLLASVEAVDIRDYTSYSYRELSSAASIAAQILNRPDNTLEELYSALVDVEINIDLLEDWGMEDGELDQLFNANEMPKVHLDPRPNSTPPHDVVTEEVTPEVIYPSHTVFPSDHTPAFPPDSTTPNSLPATQALAILELSRSGLSATQPQLPVLNGQLVAVALPSVSTPSNLAIPEPHTPALTTPPSVATLPSNSQLPAESLSLDESNDYNFLHHEAELENNSISEPADDLDYLEDEMAIVDALNTDEEPVISLDPDVTEDFDSSDLAALVDAIDESVDLEFGPDEPKLPSPDFSNLPPVPSQSDITTSPTTFNATESPSLPSSLEPVLEPSELLALESLFTASLLYELTSLPKNFTTSSSPQTSLPKTSASQKSHSSPADPETSVAQTSLRNLLKAVSILNPGDYTSSSYHNLTQATTAAGKLLSRQAMTPAETYLRAFNDVNSAYGQLQKKTDHPELVAFEEAKENLATMLAAVQNLSISDYTPESVEQFGELQVAIAKANALLSRPLPSILDLMTAMQEIDAATTGLKGVTSDHASSSTPAQPTSASTLTVPTPVVDTTTSNPPITSSPLPVSAPVQPTVAQPTPTQNETIATNLSPTNNYYYAEPVSPATSQSFQVAPQLNWSELQEVVADIGNLNANDYSSESYARLLYSLNQAKALLTDSYASQSDVDDLVFEINLNLLALEPATQGTTDSYRSAIASTTDQNVTPNLLMSMMAGAYAGLATYRKSRLDAKKRRRLSI